MDSRSSFKNLDLNIKRYIFTFCDTNTLFNLRCVSKEWHNIIFVEGTKVSHNKTPNEICNNNSFRQLLGHVALGEWNNAKKVWEQYPNLLERYGTIYHPNRLYDAKGKLLLEINPYNHPGRYKYVNRTPFQIALMNEEYDMAKEMTPHMNKEEVDKQILEISQDKKDTKNNWNEKKAKKLLKAAFKAITEDLSINDDNNNFNESTKKALHQLYDYVKPKKDGHQKGLVFDVNFYYEALQMAKNLSVAQRSLWGIYVEEYLASLLPTVYLRSHTQGIQKPTHKEGCVLESGAAYFAFRRKGESLLKSQGIFGRIAEDNYDQLFSELISSNKKKKEQFYTDLGISKKKYPL